MTSVIPASATATPATASASSTTRRRFPASTPWSTILWSSSGGTTPATASTTTQTRNSAIGLRKSRAYEKTRRTRCFDSGVDVTLGSVDNRPIMRKPPPPMLIGGRPSASLKRRPERSARGRHRVEGLRARASHHDGALVERECTRGNSGRVRGHGAADRRSVERWIGVRARDRRDISQRGHCLLYTS